MGTADTNQETTGLAGISTAAPDAGSLAALSEKYKTGDEAAWKQEQQALRSEPDLLDRIAYGMEAFGSGFRGEEPLYLKVRRQQMLEDQQRQETALKLAQMKQTQNHQEFDNVLKIMFSDAPAEIRESLVADMAAKGSAIANRVKGLATKQILGQLPGVQDWLDPDVLSEVRKMREDPNYQIKGGMARVEADIKNAAKLRDEDTKATGDQRRFDAYLTEADTAGGIDKLSPGKQTFILKHTQEAQKRALELTELNEKIKLTKSQAKVAQETEPARIAEAQQQAAPQMRQRTVDQAGNVTFEQYNGTTGKWEPIPGSENVKVSPSVNIALGGEPKAMPPEQAARFAHFLEARQAARQLPGLVFDKGGKVKSENLLTGAFPMGGLPFTEGRTLNQVIERGIQAKLRAETGAAAPENEVKNIAMRYKPALSDDAGQIKGKLKAFTDYIEDAIWLADPTGIHQGRAGTRRPTGSADERGDALKKQHPDWTDYEILARLQAEGY